MTAPRRSLFMDQYGEMGGGQTVLISLLRAALRECDEVTVLAPAGELESVVRSEFAGRVSYCCCAAPSLSHRQKTVADIIAVLSHIFRLARYLPLLRRQDIIYVNGLRHLPGMLALAPFLRAAIFYHVHLDHSRVEKTLIRLAARWPGTHRVIVNSQFVCDRLAMLPEKTVLVENALDSRFAAQPFHDRFSGTTEPAHAAVCGTLRPEKGQDIAIEVISPRADMFLHLIGRESGDAAAWLAAIRQRASSQVQFHGSTQDIPGLLEQLGIQFNIVPSRWEEPFGLAAVEGMACSCITLVSGTGGLADIAERTGALVVPDAASLAAALDKLMRTPAPALAILARAQYDAAQAAYAPERFERQVRELLRTAFATHRGSL